MLKFIAPLNKAIVWLLRKLWGGLVLGNLETWNSGRRRGTPAGPGTGREVGVPFLSLSSRLYLSSERGHGCLHALRNAEKLGFRSLL